MIQCISMICDDARHIECTFYQVDVDAGRRATEKLGHAYISITCTSRLCCLDVAHFGALL